MSDPAANRWKPLAMLKAVGGRLCYIMRHTTATSLTNYCVVMWRRRLERRAGVDVMNSGGLSSATPSNMMITTQLQQLFQESLWCPIAAVVTISLQNEEMLMVMMSLLTIIYITASSHHHRLQYQHRVKNPPNKVKRPRGYRRNVWPS